jgi:segregation and condensation protein B
MGLLQERGLIEECGRLDAPGRPILYQTTPLFLRSFGLHSLEELPPLPDGSGEELTDQLEIPLEKAEEG